MNQGGRFTGQYLYAIIDDGSAPRSLGDIGIDRASVFAISQGRIAAVVSVATEKRVRPERAKLTAHHGVIKQLMKEASVLPVAFGTIARSAQAVRDFLAANREALGKQLAAVRGRVEMGLRVSWDVPNIFEYFVDRHQELKDLRDAVYGKQRGPSQDDKIELGRLFDRLLAQDRQTHAETVLEVLSAHCVETKQNKPRKENEVMNLACLVERQALKAFEDGVLRAAARFDNNFAFDFNGPWAPHNFVHVDVDL